MTRTWKGGWGHSQSYETRRKIARVFEDVWVIERISQYIGQGIIEFEDGELLDCEGLSSEPRKTTIRLPDRGDSTVILCDIPTERAFLRVFGLRQFCRNEGLDYGRLYRTLVAGGWCADTAAILNRGEEAHIRSKYAIRARLEGNDCCKIPCGTHSIHLGKNCKKREFDESCSSCWAFTTWPDGKPVAITHSDRGAVIYAGARYRRLYPPGHRRGAFG